jgi:hypothetical protein
MLPEIVGEYFRIMEEVENESVLGALQVGVRVCLCVCVCVCSNCSMVCMKPRPISVFVYALLVHNF